MCLNYDEVDIILQGSDSARTLLDIGVHPCHFKETMLGAEEDFIRDDCVTDRD